MKQATEKIGFPAVLKTARGGYDGKGQVKITSPDELEKAWNDVGQAESILEAWIEFECELSVIVARRNSNSGVSEPGSVEVFPVTQNEHENHILRRSVVPPPANISDEFKASILKIASSLANAFNLSGTLLDTHVALVHPIISSYARAALHRDVPRHTRRTTEGVGKRVSPTPPQLR